jgi:K+-sensing histidine kinase KdpD
MLFVPFLELKTKQNIKKVKDNTIGMGLACSKALSKGMGGDIAVKHSEKMLTIFAFKIPVHAVPTQRLHS